MKDKNYFVIQGWMINNLALKGNELLIYSIIYGFSQDGESSFYGSISFIENMLKISRKTVIEVLKSLIEKNLVERTEVSHYRAKNIDSVKTTLVEKLHQTSVKTTPVASVKTTPNIYNTNNKNNNTGNATELEQNIEIAFNAFWDIYPLRKDKTKSKVSFTKAIKKTKLNIILEAIINQVENNHFRGNDGKDYIPYPSTWLNGCRWEDEINK